MTEQPAELKIAIVGSAPTSRMLAPYGDKSWHIWATSGANVGVLPRVDIWFEMHAISVMMSETMRPTTLPLYKWLREQSDAGIFNVCMLEFNEYVPKAMPFPRDEMIEKFGRNWWHSSIAYMMAMAIARGATEIGLFGVDMAGDQERYTAQRASCIHFIELAQQNGIKVHAPDESCIMAASPMYGYWEGEPFGRRLTVMTEMVQAQLNQAAQAEQAARDQKNYFAGGLEQLRYFTTTWTDGSGLELNLGNLPDLVAAAKAGNAAAAAAVDGLDAAAAPVEPAPPETPPAAT